MKDESTFESYKYNENDAIVVMITKPKKQPVKEKEPEVVKKQEEINKPEEKKDEIKKEEQPSTNITNTENQQGQGLVIGSQFDETVTMICEMGFPRDEAIRALRAAFNNPERAIEYLMNGIPESVLQGMQQQQQQPQEGMQQPQQQNFQMPGGNNPNQNIQNNNNSTGQESPLAFLARDKNFQLMKYAIQTNPNYLNTCIQQLSQTNPQLLQLINANKNEFLRLIQEPVDQSIMQEAVQTEQNNQPGVVNVTEEELLAIERLAELANCDKTAAAEAFLACDKNENLAAN